MKIESIKVLYPQTVGFELERKNIGNQYIFLHFRTPVLIYSKDGSCTREENVFMIHNKFSYQRFAVIEKQLSHDWMHITGNLDKIMQDSGLEYNKIYKLPNGDFATKIMHDLELEFLNDDDFSRKLSEYSMKRLFMLLGRAVNTQNSFLIHSRNKETLIKTRSYIHQTYSDPLWSISKMAKYAQLSQSRFCELYTDFFKISPKKDLQNIRIDHAKTLLSSSDFPIKEISLMIGYTNEYYFIRKFKESTGKTPGEYRRDISTHTV